MIDALRLLGGGALLYFGAEWLVGGAAGLARSMRVRPLIVGLTVVAYGTSAPEIVVSVQAGLGGHADLALGNVLGSNIANLGLILGLSALITPARVDGALRRREVPVLLASAALVPLVLLDDRIERWEGLLLVTLAVAYTAWMVLGARVDDRAVAEAKSAAATTEAAADTAGAPSTDSRGKMAVTAAVGLAVLILGGDLFVAGATGAAIALGMSERVVGLTIVAVGTSLPELMTSLIAARRGHSDIAIGNVVGSNIFNVLLCLGIAAGIGGLRAPLAALTIDLTGLGALTAFAALAMRSERRVTRLEGAALLAGYVAFIAAVALRS